MNKTILTIVICIIAGVTLHFLTPFIHARIHYSPLYYIVPIIVISVISIVVGIIFVMNPLKRKRSIPMFLIPITLAVSMLPHHILSQGNYELKYIIYRYDTSKFGVVDEWGITVVPKSDFESLFFAKGEKHQRFLVGVKFKGLDEKKVYEVRDIYVYKINKGRFIPVKLYRVTCGEQEDGNVSLYSYIKEHIGLPCVGDKDYMLVLKENYVKEIVEYELNEEIQTENGESEEEEEKISIENDYENIGEVEAWYEGTGEIVEIEMKRKTFMLQVKRVNGDNFYYINDGGNKILVTRYKSHYTDRWTNAKADKYYFNNPAWPLIEEESGTEVHHRTQEESQNDSYEPSQNSTPQTRQLQPMSVWVSCPACHNSGQCQACYGQGWTYSSSDRYYDGKAPCYSCGGSGKCTTCAGQGGHNEIQYR